MDQQVLVAALVLGDERAWHEFVDRYGRLIYAVAARTGLGDSEREDVFQNVCLAAVRSISRLRDPAKLSSWIYGIAYRTSVDAIRKKPRTVSSDDPGVGAQAELASANDPGIHARLEEMEELSVLYDALDLLDGRCRRLISAIYFDDPRPSYEEISRREEMPVGSIGPTRARCLEKLRKSLEGVSSGPDPTTTG